MHFKSKDSKQKRNEWWTMRTVRCIKWVNGKSRVRKNSNCVRQSRCRDFGHRHILQVKVVNFITENAECGPLMIVAHTHSQSWSRFITLEHRAHLSFISPQRSSMQTANFARQRDRLRSSANFTYNQNSGSQNIIYAYTHLIKSSKFCSLSLIPYDGLAAISHSNFGRHASRKLFAKLSLSFKSMCNNFELLFDFLAMNVSISFVDGESVNNKTKKN